MSHEIKCLKSAFKEQEKLVPKQVLTFPFKQNKIYLQYKCEFRIKIMLHDTQELFRAFRGFKCFIMA